MTRWRDLAVALAALTAAAGCSHSAAPATRPPAPTAAGRPAAGTAAIEEYLAGLASAGRFSGTVLVARDGRVLLNAGYGLADRAARVRNGPQTIFQVGYLLYETRGTTTLIGIDREPGPLMRDGLSAAGYRHVAEPVERHVCQRHRIQADGGVHDSRGRTWR